MEPNYEAIALYERARRQGWWHRTWARLRRRPTRLLELSAAVAGNTICGRHYLGTQTVPLNQIRGTEGRPDTFDDAFHPIAKQTRERWLGIATAWLLGVGLPPVELIRLGALYVVRDGHHRISVARALEISEIDAVVTAWDVATAPRPVPDAANVSQGSLARMAARLHSAMAAWPAGHGRPNQDMAALQECIDCGTS
jgi:hypothetical protein